jgi:ATP-dependent RNA helicase RhlE
MKSFSELPLSALLKTNLGRHGYIEPTPVQAQAIEPVLAGKDLVATAQTGTGKTLAFVLPMIHLLEKQPRGKGIRAVILTPTRELAIQIDETFVKLAAGTGITTAVVVGGVSEKTQLHAIRRSAQVLIATPGRLYDFLSRKLVDLGGARMLVLDEADRMLDMGFLPTVKRIMAALPSDRQTLLFSATIESSVKQLVETQVRNAVRVEVGSTTKPVEQVDLHLYEVDQDQKLGLLQSMLGEGDGSFLVFARTKRGADRLSKRLSGVGVKTAVIHGDRSQNQRNQALRGFQEGYYRVLVATDVAARGIHVEGIAHVVNYDLPQSPEDFIHRAGRTGRLGASGTASTFATRAERSDVAQIERALTVRLVRRQVAASVPREVKSTASVKGAAPVIVMPARVPERQQRVRTFGPKARFRRSRAV